MRRRVPRGAMFFWVVVATLLGLFLLSTVWWSYDPEGNLDISHRSTDASQLLDPRGHGRIISVQLQPVPEGPVSSLYRRGASTTNRRDRPLRAIAGYIPRPLPAPLDQNGCGSGGDLVVTFP